VVYSGVLFLGERKCERCGAALSDEDFMKIILEDGSCETFPLSTCPECFKKEMFEKARRTKEKASFFTLNRKSTPKR
jgi:hypothetical protein